MEKSNCKLPTATIYLEDTLVDIGMFPNGDYCLNQAQVAQVIGEPLASITQFLDSEEFKVNWASRCQIFDISEVYLEGSTKPIVPISINVATCYWQNCAVAGNEKANELILTLMMNTLCGKSTFTFDPTQN
ncbi:MAG: hypothetical protein QNJ32_31205 [Xenococcaceae cyanobacterium MO_167.B27]|nr:hypothetical protein [Xenococcaceae cyanobacterium MO_167.B27]